MSDIVENLREWSKIPKSMVMTDVAMREAADEIERLRAQRDELLAALKAAKRELAAIDNDNDELWEQVRAAIAKAEGAK